MSYKLSPEEILTIKKTIESSLHCAMPGKIVAYDSDAQIASVQPLIKRCSVSFPVIHNVPVFFPGTRSSAITWPVQEDDECLLVFSDSDIDSWFESGEESDPDSGRNHDLADAFAFVGFRSRRNALQDLPENASFFGIDPADVSHNHDDRYYTESEMDTLLSGKKNTQSAVSDPSASGTSATFIATLSQNAQGVITPTKKTVRTMTAATADAAGTTGLVPAPAKGAQGKFLKGNATWATPAVSEGGTGMTGTGATTTITDIATAATDCEITTAQYAYWGKVAMVRLVVKKTTAVSSGTTTLCTMVSGKRPKYNAAAIWSWNNGAVIGSNGKVQVNGAISAGASLSIMSTYVLA